MDGIARTCFKQKFHFYIYRGSGKSFESWMGCHCFLLCSLFEKFKAGLEQVKLEGKKIKAGGAAKNPTHVTEPSAVPAQGMGTGSISYLDCSNDFYTDDKN